MTVIVCGACAVQNPADNDVKLSTAPDPTGATHWGQQVFYVNPPIDCAPNDTLAATLKLTRKKENHRLLKVEMKVKVGHHNQDQDQGGEQ
jgi:protein arginine N-methyltransferase 1